MRRSINTQKWCMAAHAMYKEGSMFRHVEVHRTMHRGLLQGLWVYTMRRRGRDLFRDTAFLTIDQVTSPLVTSFEGDEMLPYDEDALNAVSRRYVVHSEIHNNYTEG